MPPPSTGLTLWFDGASGSAFSDFAGAVPAVAPYGRVARVDQASPAAAGSWLTADQITSRGWKDPAGVDLQYGARCFFTQPAGLSVPANKCVWGFSLQFRANSTSATYISIFTGNDTVGDFGASIFFGQLVIYCHGSANFTTGLQIPGGATIYGWIKYDTSLVTWAYTVNGTPYSGSFAATPPASAATSAVTFGKNTNNGSAFNYTQIGAAQLLGYDNTSGTVDTTALYAYLATQVESLPTTIPLVIASGDSIGAGANVSPWLTQFYLAQYNLAGNNPPFRMVNSSVGGRTIAAITTGYATEVRPFIVPGRKTILCVEGITNSMPCASGSESATAASVLSTLYAYCDQALADGVDKLLLWTCLPRSDASAGTGFPGCWAIVNADIRANAAARGYRLVDVAAVPGMSLISDAAGANFGDALHPSAAGHALIEPIVRAALTLALGTPAAPNLSLSTNSFVRTQWR